MMYTFINLFGNVFMLIVGEINILEMSYYIYFRKNLIDINLAISFLLLP